MGCLNCILGLCSHIVKDDAEIGPWLNPHAPSKEEYLVFLQKWDLSCKTNNV
jgi:hypothetical protein